MSLHIIAEACTNHDGNIEKAKQLVTSAKETGADSIKFQMINPESLYISKIYEEDKMVDNPVIARRKLGQLKDAEYAELAEYAKSLGIGFSASVFDAEGLALLESFSPPYIKIASCDINNLPFLTQVAKAKCPIILSTGMTELKEVENALNCMNKVASPQIVILHCVSIYPAPVEETNLSMIPLLKETFGLEVGFSDHTLNSTAAIAALTLGATWFEKHFTLNTSDEGVDHAHSTPPSLFTEYVTALRSTEKALTVKAVKVGEVEQNVRNFARRGLYAARDLKAGEILQANDILIVRPEAEFKPTDMDLVVGKSVQKDVVQFQPIKSDLLK